MANKGIILSDQEREELLELSGSGDSALALRATIILDCANHKMIKEIATNHHIDGRTIRKWRTRFLEKGVKGLIVPNTGVSVTKSTEIVATTQRVKELVKAHNGAINPKAIASELGLNITKVYRILDKENISVVRQRSTNWLYTTADQQIGNGPYLAGLYLSCSFKAYILCDTNEPLDGKTIHGVVWMRDAAFAKEMENSASTLRLADTLYAATTHMDFRHAGNGITCKDFITEVIDSWPEGADYRFRVLYLGKTFPGYQGDRILGIHYSSFDSFSELRRYVLMQYVDPDDESRYQSVRKLLKVADDYVHVQQPGSDPFVWRMLYGEYTPLKTILNSDEVNGVTDDASTIEKAMEGLFDLETIEVGNSCIKTVICMKDSSGQLTFRVVGGNSLFPGIDEGCISTPEAFEHTINQLDREMSDLSRKVDLAGRELFLTNLKKNNTSSEP